MTMSTAALGLSARMTHQTPAGHKRNQVRETEDKLKYVKKQIVVMIISNNNYN